jgi:hypothetical protein
MKAPRKRMICNPLPLHVTMTTSPPKPYTQKVFAHIWEKAQRAKPLSLYPKKALNKLGVKWKELNPNP